MPDASPAKWHLAHTTWFFETFLLRDRLPGYTLFDERWPFLFNSYYEGEGERIPRAQRGMLSRPSLDQIADWRAHVDEAMRPAARRSGARALIELGIAHEQQHQELLLTDIKHALFQNPLAPAMWALPEQSARLADKGPEWHEHPGGIAMIGHQGDASRSTTRDRRTASCSSRSRSPGGSSATVNGNSSSPTADTARASLWLSDGWDWVQAQADRGAALLVEKRAFHPRRLAGARSVGAGRAYLVLRGRRLRHWAGARCRPSSSGRRSRKGHDPAAATSSTGRPPLPRAAPRCSATAGSSPARLTCLIRASPGRGAVGEYNGKFMAGQWVLKGASCATVRGHSRASYRNFFYPHSAGSSPACGWRRTCDGAADASRWSNTATTGSPPRSGLTCSTDWRRIPRRARALVYDDAGSELFEAITRLPEVLPDARRDRDPAAALQRFPPPDRRRAARSSSSVLDRRSRRRCCSIASSRGVSPARHLGRVPARRRGRPLRQVPGLPVHPVEADFMQPVRLPDAVVALPKLGFFPGSTNRQHGRAHRRSTCCARCG
jgi:hypothetical protein